MILFVTYRDGNTLKKARLTEEKLSNLRSNPTITEVMIYPNEIIMEKTYGNLTGSNESRNMLLD